MLRAGHIQEGALDALRPPLTRANDQARRLWNLMGGCIDWSALPILCALHDIAELEDLLWRLVLIRDA